MARQAQRLEGRVVAITGAARGIGLATARALASRGATVAIGDLDEALAARAAEEAGAALGLGLDVSDAASFAGFLDEVERRLGPLDVLVNNAGVMAVATLDALDQGHLERILRVNLGGVATGMRLAVERMAPRGRGHIVNLASGSSWVAPPGLSAYAASKHGVRGLADAVREEVRPLGIRVTSIFPNVVETDLAAGTRPARGGRLIRPEQVGEAIARAIARPRAEVFVPREIGALLRLQAALPPRGRALVARALGLHSLYTSGVDVTARREYEAGLRGSDG